ncbi:MAG: 3-phosphoshikimate 1-carboxyvinyltransferase, partial [Thermoguttaceae bacterium]
VGFCDCLAKMGCEVEYLPDAIRVRREPGAPLHGIETDMHFISDTAQTLAVVALFADSPTTIRNVANMRVKETDRIHAVVTELRKFGVEVKEFEDGMTIQPLKQTPPAVEIETYNDHRMAMSFAIAGLRLPGVTILNPGCTVKTYPGFWDDLEKIKKGR